jgi:hypothetical protein
VDVHAASAARNPHLRPPEADPRATGQHPDGVAMLPALDDRESEQLRIEALGPLEVEDVEHELVHSGRGDAAYWATSPVASTIPRACRYASRGWAR